MPKQVPAEAKRVALNCLVLPETLAYLRAADGSQGHAVDRAVAALRMRSGHHEPNWLWCERCQAWIETEHLCGAQYIDKGSHYELVKAAATRPAKSSQSWKRGPRPKGDKSR